MEWITNMDFDALLSWLQAEVLPHVASVSVILGVALVELIPAVRALLRARSVFAKVAADAEGYVRDKRDYDARAEAREAQLEKRVEQLCETVAACEARMRESEERVRAAVGQVERSASRTERMLYLGMSNSQELIINGAARKIAQIEEELYEEQKRDEEAHTP